MADRKNTGEREYVIPLRKEWSKVPEYKRTAKSVKAIKEFIAKHMKIPDRDTKKVKLDPYFNNELWFRGRKKPFSKVKVKAVRDGDIIRVDFVEVPEIVKFTKSKLEKRHKKPEKKPVTPAVPSTEEKKDEKKEDLEEKVAKVKTEDEKEGEGEEKEKAKSVEQANIKIAEKAAKVQKHTVKGKGPQIQRKALKK